MNTQENNQQKVQPCPHMKGLLSGYADGTLKGISEWYTRLHVAGCPQCTQALDDLRQMLQKLRGLRPQTTEIPTSEESNQLLGRDASEWAKVFKSIDEKLQ
jgi:hypothetical protein